MIVLLLRKKIVAQDIEGRRRIGKSALYRMGGAA
jgi:hypothetical protein